MPVLSASIEQQPRVRQFFSGAIREGALAHAYIFKGNDYAGMYAMALEIAQILNCTEPIKADQACGHCQNCRWVEKNAHPSVMTVSRMSFLVEDKPSEQGPPEFMSPEEAHALTKKGYSKLIRAGQIERLLYQLGLHARDYRVVIFTDSEVLPASQASPENTNPVPPPWDWQAIEANQDKRFLIRPLSSGLFNDASANRFLKTLEEPPPKTLFFFITESEDHLLPTIVSRCQVVPFARQIQAGPGLSQEQRRFLAQLMEHMATRPDFYQSQAMFQTYFIEEQELSAVQALGLFQQYLHEIFHQSPLSPDGFADYHRMQQALDHAQKQILAKTHEHQTLNHLFISLHGNHQ